MTFSVGLLKSVASNALSRPQSGRLSALMLPAWRGDSLGLEDEAIHNERNITQSHWHRKGGWSTQPE